MDSRTTAIDGLTMHYRVSTGPVPAGRPPVVLVHGQVVSSRYMVPLAERLAPDFRVYAPDLPGFGRSAKPARVLDIPLLADTLAAWMDAVGLERAALIGNSLGCQVLVEFGVRHGERAAGLVLQGPTPDPGARSYLRHIVRFFINGRHESSAELSPKMRAIMVEDYRAAGVRRAITTFRYMLHHRIEDRLPEVRPPTLVVRGTRDSIVPHAWARRVADLLPNGRLVEVAGAAHTMNFFAPERLARVVRPWLGLTPAVRRHPRSPRVVS